MSLPERFIVRVNINDSFMYWTLSGSVIYSKDAYVFTEATIPDLCKQAIQADYIDIIEIKKGA